MIGYLKLRKDTGHVACIRVDEIAAFSENETKVKTGSGSQAVPCVTVLLRNNVAWHFPHVTLNDLLLAMRGASQTQINVDPQLLEKFTGEPGA